jgi:hypothetical protein
MNTFNKIANHPRNFAKFLTINPQRAVGSIHAVASDFNPVFNDQAPTRVPSARPIYTEPTALRYNNHFFLRTASAATIQV